MKESTVTGPVLDGAGQRLWGAGGPQGGRGRWDLVHLVNEFDFQTTKNECHLKV